MREVSLLKLYDNPSDQAAFDRWVDITARLLLKYGPEFLRTRATASSDRHIIPFPQPVSPSVTSLEDSAIAA